MGEVVDVTRPCEEMLARLGIFAWPNNTGAIKVGDRFIRFGFKGSADILGILPTGIFLAVECKTETGTQSKDQKTFQRNIEKNGGLYLMVRSDQDLLEQLRQYVRLRLLPTTRSLFPKLLTAGLS